ncbi:hypothetical protein [Alcaligenes faecalis]|uniref:hypothetical protein n=1 Tax=Alcaligenes faecalis TaxID=511 RepID=UPI000F0B7A00|nr:hypothetical protein [Alcaligenes faecalis]AYR19464.1 hypothetical protein D6I95_03240 [Alcaligenes faecalis]
MTSLNIDPKDIPGYTEAIGAAGQSYMDRFPYAHKLPVQFRWSDLWDAMVKAAIQAQQDVSLSDNAVDSKLAIAIAEVLREASSIIRSIPAGQEPDNMRFPIIDELDGFASMILNSR